jgi:NifU-like protein involved in Fe-S cluster formation
MSKNEIDLINLYSSKILKLAAKIPMTSRLTEPHATVKKHSPVCGSTVTVDIKLKDDHIIEFGQDIKACALGQAAASVLGTNIIGLSTIQIKKGREQLYKMLTETGPIPDPPFEEYEPLRSAQNYHNRHASIMLTADAVVEAIDNCGLIANSHKNEGK